MSCWHVVEHSLYKGETNLMATRTDLSSVLTDREEEAPTPTTRSGSLRTQAH